MTRNQITGLLLTMGAVVFISIILFIEKMSGADLSIGMFVMTATGAFFLYLYSHRLSKTRRWMLLMLYIVPALSIFISRLLKS